MVARQQVETHDQKRKSSQVLAKRWVTLFNDTRYGFRTEMAKEPIANRSVTLRALGRMYEEAEARGDLVVAMKLLEQAAKECGDIYSTRKQGTDAGKTEPATRVEVEFVPVPHKEA